MSSFTHGANGYKNHKCRCDICKESYRVYQKIYRELRKSNVQKRIDRRFGHREYDLEVVLTKDFAKLVRNWQLVTGTSNVQLALLTGVSDSYISRLEQPKHTRLSIADRILVFIGESAALSDGTLQIVPNPRFTQERWIKEMRRRGCEIDDA